MKTKKSSLNQQQILKKLSNIKNKEEFKKIYKSIQAQNNTLRNDILDLKYKIQLLQQKQKTKQQYRSPDDIQKTQQIQTHQTQLKSQYKIMQQLKKRKQLSSSEQGTQQLNEQQINVTNRLKIIENQLNLITKQHKDIKNQNKFLQKSIQSYLEQEKRNQPKVNEFNNQNNELRKKITSMKKIGFLKEYQSAKIMNSMYTIKDKYNKNQQMFQQVQKKKSMQSNKTSTKNQTKIQNSNIDTLQRQIQQLKKQIKQVQKDQLKRSYQAMKRKQQLFQQNKIILADLKQIEQKRNKLQRQLNKNKKIWEKYIENKNNNSKFIKEYQNKQIQITPFQDQNPLRRQYAGFLGGKITFDDREALKTNKQSFIVGFTVYELQHNASARHLLIGIRAIYNDQQANLSNNLPIPSQYLSKCKVSKYLLVEGDFVKLFKIKYHSVQSRILKVQIRTNKNNKYQFGDKRAFNDLQPGENVYAFDISIQEYPVSLFGSYNNIRSHWYLQSLGVQINELPSNL